MQGCNSFVMDSISFTKVIALICFSKKIKYYPVAGKHSDWVIIYLINKFIAEDK